MKRGNGESGSGRETNKFLKEVLRAAVDSVQQLTRLNMLFSPSLPVKANMTAILRAKCAKQYDTAFAGSFGQNIMFSLVDTFLHFIT